MSLEMLFQQVAHYRDADELLGLCQSLSVDQGRELALYTLDKLKQGKTDQDTFGQTIELLVAHVPDAIRSIEQELFPHITTTFRDLVYMAAGSETRDHLIKLSKLRGLAWIGDDAAQCTLIDQSDYLLLEAGWVFDKNQQRRDLFHQTAYELFATEDHTPVQVMLPQSERCHWCDLPLLTLFDLDLRDRRFGFLGLTGDRVRIAMCQRCTQFGPVFTAIDTAGKSVWYEMPLPDARIPEEEVMEYEPIQAFLNLAPRRTPYEVVPLPFMFAEGQSQIGGCPSWLQSPDYPKCPQCQRYMMFIGQLYAPLVEIYDEGTIYAHLCSECMIAATLFQQT